MLGRRSIDELLGPEHASASPARAGGWLREWPLLVGLACSLGLIGGAMLVDAPDAPPVAQATASPAAAADYSAGEVVDVGESDAAETGTEPSPTASAKPAKRRGKSSKASSAPATDAAPTEPSSGASAGSGGGGTAPGRSGSRRAPSSAPRTAKIVNVTGTSASVTNGPLAYTLTAPTHTPTVGKPWRLSVSATRNGKPLTGRVKIDILHDGAIVGHAADGALRGGRLAHDFPWPKESVGHPLTVKTTISGGGVQQSFLFDVKVKAAG